MRFPHSSLWLQKGTPHAFHASFLPRSAFCCVLQHPPCPIHQHLVTFQFFIILKIWVLFHLMLGYCWLSLPLMRTHLKTAFALSHFWIVIVNFWCLNKCLSSRWSQLSLCWQEHCSRWREGTACAKEGTSEHRVLTRMVHSDPRLHWIKITHCKNRFPAVSPYVYCCSVSV